jgi:hypothetical protein
MRPTHFVPFVSSTGTELLLLERSFRPGVAAPAAEGVVMSARIVQSLMLLPVALLLLFVFYGSARAQTDAPITGVVWMLKDSVSACPAGDSVVAGHPARLRITLMYRDSDEHLRNGVPPDSFWVTFTQLDSAQAKDEGDRTYADDSTRSGFTRITIPSLSGNGTLRIRRATRSPLLLTSCNPG